MLLEAVAAGDVSAVRRILSRSPASASERSSDSGDTPLHVAASLGLDEVVELLLEHGASPAAMDGLERTPLHRAAEQGHVATAGLLIPNSDCNAQDSFGRTALHWACKIASPTLASMLVTSGRADVDAASHSGDSALHWACNGIDEPGARAELARLLLAAGANARARNKAGQRPAEVTADPALQAILVQHVSQLEEAEEALARAEDERARAAAEARRAEAHGATAASAGGGSAAGAARHAWGPSAGSAPARKLARVGGGGAAAGTGGGRALKIRLGGTGPGTGPT